VVVFDSDLSNATNDWQVSADCSFGRAGLFASGSDIACAYVPSTTHDYLSQGFRLNMTLAADVAVDKVQIPVLEAGTAFFSIQNTEGHEGSFVLADAAHYSDSQVTGSTVNWHTNGLTVNTIRLEWDGPGTSLVAYTNGFKAAELPFSMSAKANHTIKLGADTDAQALYTHVTLASPQG
jgi:hypothetical protein